jgi:Na+/proline symporter
MGCLIGSAVVPVACAIVWKKANMWGCTVGAISGLVLGIMSFLVVAAKLNDGVVTVETTGQDFPMVRLSFSSPSLSCSRSKLIIPPLAFSSSSLAT